MNPVRSVRLDKEASTRWKDPGKDPRGITKRDSTPDGYKEWGVRVCGDPFCGNCCGIAVLQNQAVSRIKKFTGNFNAVCGFLMLFCAVFIRISVRFCGIRIPLTPPFVRRRPWNARVTGERKNC